MIEDQLPRHACGLFLEHNPNRNVYESVQDWIEDDEAAGTTADFKNAEQKLRAITTDELWILEWYPDTPIGSYAIAAPTLAELLSFAAEFDEEPNSEDPR